MFLQRRSSTDDLEELCYVEYDLIEGYAHRVESRRVPVEARAWRTSASSRLGRAGPKTTAVSEPTACFRGVLKCPSSLSSGPRFLFLPVICDNTFLLDRVRFFPSDYGTSRDDIWQTPYVKLFAAEEREYYVNVCFSTNTRPYFS